MSWATPRFIMALPGASSARPGAATDHRAAWSPVRPTPVAAPRLLAASTSLAERLGFAAEDLASPGFAATFSGCVLPDGLLPVATSYGGHQFGHWAGPLGDGRAILLGERIDAAGQRWELQLKGAGPTPYSRRADGRAVLRSSLREFVCSEAMHALGVPTTRALSLIASGESVVRDLLYDGNPRPEPGAVVCRVAPSFLRFGHLELPASRTDHALLASFVDHAMSAHFPEYSGSNARADWFVEVARRTGLLMAHWMRVGFVHGVMNTDNMSLLGLTIDYGPFGFLDDFNPHWTPNTTDLPGRRYRYAAQPEIAHWNLSALASAIAPLFADTTPLRDALNAYVGAFQQAQARMFADKLGLADWRERDVQLLQALYAWMQAAEVDFSLFFRCLGERVEDDPNFALTLAEPLRSFAPALYDETKAAREAPALLDWLVRYAHRLDDDPQTPTQRRIRMDAANPLYLPRNWLLQQAIDAAEVGDFGELHALQAVLECPYTTQPGAERFAARRPDWARNRPGCSALSCSS